MIPFSKRAIKFNNSFLESNTALSYPMVINNLPYDHWLAYRKRTANFHDLLRSLSIHTPEWFWNEYGSNSERY